MPGTPTDRPERRACSKSIGLPRRVLEHRRGAVGRALLAAVDRDDAVLLGQVDHHESAAARTGHERLGDTERARRRDRGVDRVAAVTQHLRCRPGWRRDRPRRRRRRCRRRPAACRQAAARGCRACAAPARRARTRRAAAMAVRISGRVRTPRPYPPNCAKYPQVTQMVRDSLDALVEVQLAPAAAQTPTAATAAAPTTDPDSGHAAGDAAAASPRRSPRASTRSAPAPASSHGTGTSPGPGVQRAAAERDVARGRHPGQEGHPLGRGAVDAEHAHRHASERPGTPSR